MTINEGRLGSLRKLTINGLEGRRFPFDLESEIKDLQGRLRPTVELLVALGSPGGQVKAVGKWL